MAPRRAAAGHLSVDTSGSAAPGPSSALTSASTEGGGGGLSPATENSEDAGAVAKGLSLDSGSDEDEDGSGKRKSGGTNLGRRKIDIEYIEEKNKRHITFSKRKAGIMKKAYELSKLTGTEVLLLVVSETGLVYTFTTPKLSPLVTARRGKNLIQRCLSDDPSNLMGKEYPEPRMRQYMAPKGVLSAAAQSSNAKTRGRAVSQPRRLPPPEPMSVPDESTLPTLPDAAGDSSSSSSSTVGTRSMKRRKTVENLRLSPQPEAPLPPMPPPSAPYGHHARSHQVQHQHQHQQHQQPPPSPTFSRSLTAAAMFSEYCMFAGQRYQHHFDPEMPAIEGTFFIQFVAESYIIFDELQFNVDPMFVASQSPFKIRMPPCLNALLRRGDNVECTIRKAQGASFWLPLASGRIVEVPEGRIGPDYMPQPQEYEAEMEHRRQIGDHQGFAAAYNAFHKESRAVTLLALGEFDDEGFVPSRGLAPY